MKLLLGIDLGTSYFKVGLFDQTGALRGLARVRVEPVSPRPGWAELPLEQFWILLRGCLHQALKIAHAAPTDVEGISYSSQANTFLLLDKTDTPITPLILWTDQRATVPATFAAFVASNQFAETAGFSGLGPEWAVAKLAWFRQHEPGKWHCVRRIKTISDYFCFALTGQHVGDAGTASFLGLYDLRRHAWWPQALASAGIDSACMSQPLPQGTVVGPTIPLAHEILGLPAGVPFCVGGLDHQVAALGSGLGTKADASISTGTVLAAMRLVSSPTARPGCFHGPSFRRNEYYRLAFNADGAGRLECLQADLCPQVPIGEMITAALPEYADAPPADGLSLHTREKIRAALLHIARAHAQLLRLIDPASDIKTLVATGGGARSIPWLRLKVDLFNLPIIRPACPERACLGAAILAALGAGWFETIDEACSAMSDWHAPIIPGASRVPLNRIVSGADSF